MVLDRLAKENGITVSDAVVDAALEDLDEQVRASGDPRASKG
jgi:hypothetical protein